jgi:hypothetical protein
MKKTLRWTIIIMISLSANASDYESVKEIFNSQCMSCHGTKFHQAPRKRFFKKIATFFDFKNDGRRQKVPSRMSGVLLTQEEVVEIKDWIRGGAIVESNEKSFDEKQVKSILNSGR